jgi:adenosylhomocysteine nucleosidase
MRKSLFFHPLIPSQGEHKMNALIVIPLQEEAEFFLEACEERGQKIDRYGIGKLSVSRCPGLGITVAIGGLGKVQFAIQTQHLLDKYPDWELVICAGSAGALSDSISIGDVVVSTETVEHDIKNKFGRPLLPRFTSASSVLTSLQSASTTLESASVHFGIIASGDEDVIDAEHRKMLRQRTGALAVAWEGAGGARACEFSGFPFIEIRGVTDTANHEAAESFIENIELAMKNIAALVLPWFENSQNH